MVVGGGIGGLAVACVLAKAGRAVLLLEASAWLGGACVGVTRDGHRYDVGVSPITGTGPGGAVENRYAYEPFGTGVSATESIPNRRRFVAREGVRSDESGLEIMRARLYDAEIGRFLSEDPIGLDGGINLYTYSNNQPTTTTDPTGLKGLKLPCKLEK